MVIDVHRILVGGLMDRDPIDKPEINAAMTIVQMMMASGGPPGTPSATTIEQKTPNSGGASHTRRRSGTDRRGER